MGNTKFEISDLKFAISEPHDSFPSQLQVTIHESPVISSFANRGLSFPEARGGRARRGAWGPHRATSRRAQGGPFLLPLRGSAGRDLWWDRYAGRRLRDRSSFRHFHDRQ